MTVQGGMTQMRNKLRDDPEFQKLYTRNKSGGQSEGKSGKSVFCDSMTSPQYGSECNGVSFKQPSFEKYAGPWKDLKHK